MQAASFCDSPINQYKMESIITLIKNFFKNFRLAKVTVFWKVYHQLVGDYQSKLRALHEQYGTVHHLHADIDTY